MAVSANRLELLQIADAVAREKSIDRLIVIQSMQDAIEKAAKTRYGAETEIRAEINPRTGELKLTRLREVVEAVVGDLAELLRVAIQLGGHGRTCVSQGSEASGRAPDPRTHPRG